MELILCFWMQIGRSIRLEHHYGLLYMVLQIQRRVRLRLHQGKTINSENNTRRFRNVEQFIRIVRSMQSSMVDDYKTGMSIEETDVQETGLGLVGPGNVCLARLLETLFGWPSTFRLHALYHDVFG